MFCCSRCGKAETGSSHSRPRTDQSVFGTSWHLTGTASSAWWTGNDFSRASASKGVGSPAMGPPPGPWDLLRPSWRKTRLHIGCLMERSHPGLTEYPKSYSLGKVGVKSLFNSHLRA